MTQPRTPFREAPLQPGELREILRDLARWACASSLGLVASCAATHNGALPGRVMTPPNDSIAGRGTGGTGRGTGSAGSAIEVGGGESKPMTPPGTGGTPAQESMGQSGAGGTPAMITAGAGGSVASDGNWTAWGCSLTGSLLLADLQLSRGLDYLGLWQEFNSSPQPAWTQAIAEAGTSCASAKAPGACETDADAKRTPKDACRQDALQCNRFVVSTSGDSVTRDDAPGAFDALVLPIDTPQKALLLAVYGAAANAADAQALGCSLTRMGPETLATESGFDVRLYRGDCTGVVHRTTVHMATDGTATREETETPGPSRCYVGRRPEGLAARTQRAHASALGAFLADAARLEAASVFAFERLARELLALGAPLQLVAEAARSALDEVRHARVMGALAERFGGVLLPLEVAAPTPRAAFAIALENAIEGCVRETYGALVALHQALHARDEALRAAMTAIADDEARHAELAWRVAGWLEPRLDPAQRAALSHARREALAQLQREIDPGLAHAALQTIGWPAPELAQQLIARLGAALEIG